jgi:hypothetical protein
MVLGNNPTKKPLYTVKVETKSGTTSGGSSGNSTKTQQVYKPTAQEAPRPKPVITVENMTMEQLLASYKKNDDDEEPMLPGFNYLKKMKNTIKAERVKSVLRR